MRNHRIFPSDEAVYKVVAPFHEQYGRSRVDDAHPPLETGPQSLDSGIRGAVSSLNTSSGNDILETPGMLLPTLPSTLDQGVVTRQMRGKQPGTVTWVWSAPRGLLEPWSVEEDHQAASERSASHVRTRRLAK